MSQTTNLHHSEGIDKLKHLVAEIDICLFCTNLKINDGATCRPMSAQKVCDQGNIWFFSDVHNDMNAEIKKDKHVQLFFYPAALHAGSSSPYGCGGAGGVSGRGGGDQPIGWANAGESH